MVSPSIIILRFLACSLNITLVLPRCKLRPAWRTSIFGDPGAVCLVERKGAKSTSGRVPVYRISPNHFQTLKRILAPDWAQKCFYYCAQLSNSICWVLFVYSYKTAVVSPYLFDSFTKIVRERETFISTSLARKEGTTDDSGKNFGYYQQKHFNWQLQNRIFAAGSPYSS